MSTQGARDIISRRDMVNSLRVVHSGVAPANQTEESEVCELPGKESGTGSGTRFCL